MFDLKKTTLPLLTAALVLAAGSASAAISGDGVASFDLGNSVGSGDITNNPNGLSIDGQVGSWASITTGSPSATDDGVTLTFGGGGTPLWQGTAGDNRGTGSAGAIRISSTWSPPCRCSGSLWYALLLLSSTSPCGRSSSRLDDAELRSAVFADVVGTHAANNWQRDVRCPMH